MDSEDQEDGETFPQPAESSEDTKPSGGWGDPEWERARLDRWMRVPFEQNDWESWRRPDWWTPAWETLGSVFDENGKRLHPGTPVALKESITEDVLVMDQVVREVGTNSETGEDTDRSSDPNLASVASGVLWNRHGSTMLRRGGLGMDPNDLILRLFEVIVKFVPNRCSVTYATSSD
jgi:hypothetical protein